jgi:hypothetical protein
VTPCYLVGTNISEELISTRFCLRVKHLCDRFPGQNGLKQDALLPLLFNSALECSISKVQEIQV